jgi:hypothetical protein
MKRVWAPLLAVIAGIAVGLLSAWLVLSNGQLLGGVQYDYWFGNKNTGSAAADPYTRGIIAKIGLLALNRSETIYFHRYKDGTGQRLSESCAYEMKGGALPTRWWSITIYAADDFLPMTEDRAFSVDATQVVRDADGSWTARIAADRAGAANWISSRAAGKFSLGLRMYNPADGARDDASGIPFPTIRLIGCPGSPS